MEVVWRVNAGLHAIPKVFKAENCIMIYPKHCCKILVWTFCDMVIFTEVQFYKWVTVLKLKHKANVMERLLEAETESVKKTVSEQIFRPKTPQNILRYAWFGVNPVSSLKWKPWLNSRWSTSTVPPVFQTLPGDIYYYFAWIAKTSTIILTATIKVCWA